ncbi:uncharacterized protein YggE [Marmoricola sp. OAE513]|uniref:SIMPL domain-containing protein n=1 Tax=Marmoricola sp. OAE513 TaxID=2817894 RepID=UPI001AE88770
MKRYLEVTGSGVATGIPDRLDLSLSVTAVRPGVAAALTEVDERVAALGVVLREHGVAEGDIRSTGSTVHEEYAGPDNARAGFRASHDLSVRVGDLTSLGDLVAAATGSAGDAFRLQGITWGVADESELASRARAAAYQDARGKAEELAALAGRELGPLLRLAETDGAGPVPRFALAKADDRGFAPERGSHRVEITLMSRWALR